MPGIMKLNTAVMILASNTLIDKASSRSWRRSDEIMAKLNTGSVFTKSLRPKILLQRRMQPQGHPATRITNNQARECVPRSSQYSRDDQSMHDVGILDCDSDKYCQEDETSSLGGYCISYIDDYERDLQDYYMDTFMGTEACDPNVESYYDCDCSGFDPETEIGSFSCLVYENYCFLDSVCGDFVIRSEVTEAGSIFNYCFSFIEPFPAEFCYEIHQDDTCEITVNGKPCTSCAIVDVQNPELGYTSFNCFAFDCTNTLAQLAGNDCLGTYLLDGVFPVGSESTSPPAFAPSNKTLPATNMPSLVPSIAPSIAVQNSSHETAVPFQSAPTSSMAPSPLPTVQTTDIPSLAPTTSPTKDPSATPTISPKIPSTTSPTNIPTSNPSVAPTLAFSTNPTLVPSPGPSFLPSAGPSSATDDTNAKSNTSTPPALAVATTPKPTPFPPLSPEFPRRDDPSIENLAGTTNSSGSRSILDASVSSLALAGMMVAMTLI